MSTVQSHSPAGSIQLLLTNKIGIIATAGLLNSCRCVPPGRTFIIIGRESRLKQDGCETYLESLRDLCLLLASPNSNYERIIPRRRLFRSSCTSREYYFARRTGGEARTYERGKKKEIRTENEGLEKIATVVAARCCSFDSRSRCWETKTRNFQLDSLAILNVKSFFKIFFSLSLCKFIRAIVQAVEKYNNAHDRERIIFLIISTVRI